MCTDLFGMSYCIEVPLCLFDYGHVWRCINIAILSALAKRFVVPWDRIENRRTKQIKMYEFIIYYFLIELFNTEFYYYDFPSLLLRFANFVSVLPTLSSLIL